MNLILNYLYTINSRPSCCVSRPHRGKTEGKEERRIKARREEGRTQSAVVAKAFFVQTCLSRTLPCNPGLAGDETRPSKIAFESSQTEEVTVATAGNSYFPGSRRASWNDRQSFALSLRTKSSSLIDATILGAAISADAVGRHVLSDGYKMYKLSRLLLK